MQFESSPINETSLLAEIFTEATTREQIQKLGWDITKEEEYELTKAFEKIKSLAKRTYNRTKPLIATADIIRRLIFPSTEPVSQMKDVAAYIQQDKKRKTQHAVETPQSKNQYEGSLLQEILFEGRMTPGKGYQFHDPASKANLHKKSLIAGTTALKKAGLTREPGTGGAYVFKDSKGVVRAKWVPRVGKEPPHWSKFEPSGNQAHYLSNSGRPVDSNDSAHRIPSNAGSPIGGTGPGSPGRLRREFGEV